MLPISFSHLTPNSLGTVAVGDPLLATCDKTRVDVSSCAIMSPIDIYTNRLRTIQKADMTGFNSINETNYITQYIFLPSLTSSVPPYLGPIPCLHPPLPPSHLFPLLSFLLSPFPSSLTLSLSMSLSLRCPSSL